MNKKQLKIVTGVAIAVLIISIIPMLCKPLEGECDMTLKIFAPPASGKNDPSQGDDWAENYYYTMEKLPTVRLEFEPVVSEVK